MGINGFYDNFLNCLNDQNDTVTAVTTIRNIEILIYNLDVNVITAIEQKLSSSADVLGQVFGEKTRVVISQISETCREEFNKIKDSLSKARESILAIVDSGSELTEESIASIVADESFTSMIESFAKIETTTSQATAVFASFAEVTATLDTVTGSVQATKANATVLVSKTDYNLDITTQASKKMFSNSTLKLQANVEESFSKFYEAAALQFTGDVEVQDLRSSVEEQVAQVTSFFDENGKRFSTFVTETFKDFTIQINELKSSISSKTQELTDFLAEAVADNSGSYSKCLAAEGNNSKMATELITTLGTNSSLCIAQQTNVTMKAQFLINYISEDVVMNLNGTSDRFCSCAVKGDSKVKERSIRCIRRVSQMRFKVFYEVAKDS